jgi:hypothetical protein
MNMASYKLVTYAGADGPRAGLVIDDEVCDAARLTGHAGDRSVLGILQDWTAARERLGNAAASPAAGEPLAATKLLAPILWPSAIYCAGGCDQAFGADLVAVGDLLRRCKLRRSRRRNGARERPRA